MSNSLVRVSRPTDEPVMFAATTHQIVESLGKDSLLPVRSVDLADNVSPFSLVLKQGRKWPTAWKPARYFVTDFDLNNILLNPLSEEERTALTKTRALASFHYETHFSLKGKIGLELYQEMLDVTLKRNTSVILQSCLGELSKEEVNLQEFLDATRKRIINLKHELVAPLLNDNSKTLCLVTGVLRLTSEAAITARNSVTGSRQVSAKLKLHSSEGVRQLEDLKTKTLVLPANTALAYTLYELQVSKRNGQFSLNLDRSGRGGFVTSLDLDLGNCDQPAGRINKTSSRPQEEAGVIHKTSSPTLKMTESIRL